MSEHCPDHAHCNCCDTLSIENTRLQGELAEAREGVPHLGLLRRAKKAESSLAVAIKERDEAREALKKWAEWSLRQSSISLSASLPAPKE